MTVGGPGTEVNNTVFYLMPAPGKGSPLAGHDLMITRTSYNLYACMHPMSIIHIMRDALMISDT